MDYDNTDFLVAFMDTHAKDAVRRLPISRVRAICRTVPTITLLSAEAPVLISRLAELFIADVTCQSYRMAIRGNTTTVTEDDIAHVFNTTPEYDFLAILRALRKNTNESTSEKEE